MTSDTTLATGLDDLLIRTFAGKVVRKDLTKLVKENANVPALRGGMSTRRRWST
jgi:Predicted ATP-dependent Lon-type protease